MFPSMLIYFTLHWYNLAYGKGGVVVNKVLKIQMHKATGGGGHRPQSFVRKTWHNALTR